MAAAIAIPVGLLVAAAAAMVYAANSLTPQGRKANEQTAKALGQGLKNVADTAKEAFGQAKVAAVAACAAVVNAVDVMMAESNKTETESTESETAETDSAESETAETEADAESETDAEGKQDKKLSRGEIKKLKENDIDPHDLKPKKEGSKYDLFKDKQGNIKVKPKDGSGPGEPTGININEL